LDDSKFTWFSGLGYNAEWGGLEGPNEGFNFRFREGADITSLFEFELYNAVEFRKVLGDGWFIGRGECLGNEWDAGMETMLKLMGEVGVTCDESTAFEESLPGVWFVW